MQSMISPHTNTLTLTSHLPSLKESEFYENCFLVATNATGTLASTTIHSKSTKLENPIQ